MTGQRVDLEALACSIRAAGVSADEIVAAMNALDDPVRDRTVAEHLRVVVADTSPSTAGTYRRYWSLLVDLHGDRPVAALTVEDLLAVVREAERTKVTRANSTGSAVAENCVAALRRFMTCAVHAGIRSTNPAMEIAKPRRGVERRRALTATELKEINTVTATTGDDNELDCLLVRFHLETGARRGGAIALRRRDVDIRDPAAAKVRLREKNGCVAWQPISGALAQLLLDHAAQRGASSDDDSVFRYRPAPGTTVGSALTRRRYNTIVTRWRRTLDWVDNENMSFHWLRHHAITSIERIAGYAVAEAFARHTTSSVTGTYITARPDEVRAAFNTYIGERPPTQPSHLFPSKSPQTSPHGGVTPAASAPVLWPVDFGPSVARAVRTSDRWVAAAGLAAAGNRCCGNLQAAESRTLNPYVAQAATGPAASSADRPAKLGLPACHLVEPSCPSVSFSWLPTVGLQHSTGTSPTRV